MIEPTYQVLHAKLATIVAKCENAMLYTRYAPTYELDGNIAEALDGSSQLLLTVNAEIVARIEADNEAQG
jgi:hypothetical protein